MFCLGSLLRDRAQMSGRLPTPHFGSVAVLRIINPGIACNEKRDFRISAAGSTDMTFGGQISGWS